MISLTVTDLTPNVGMWWYFFTEMFDHFRVFFRGVFQVSIFHRIRVGNFNPLRAIPGRTVFR